MAFTPAEITQVLIGLVQTGLTITQMMREKVDPREVGGHETLDVKINELEKYRRAAVNASEAERLVANDARLAENRNTAAMKRISASRKLEFIVQEGGRRLEAVRSSAIEQAMVDMAACLEEYVTVTKKPKGFSPRDRADVAESVGACTCRVIRNLAVALGGLPNIEEFNLAVEAYGCEGIPRARETSAAQS